VVAREHLDDFMEEAREIVENLNSALVGLEKNPGKSGETVNDIFRYFHNLKGNSGIIGYREMNALTHEAETLLNRVRKGEMATSNAMIDLLLGVVDMIETLIGAIDLAAARVVPNDTSALVARLQAAVGERRGGAAGEAGVPGAPAEREPAAAPGGSAVDDDDLKVFSETVGQQLANITLALDTLEKTPPARIPWTGCTVPWSRCKTPPSTWAWTKSRSTRSALPGWWPRPATRTWTSP
jgi:two-component system chemotaxis sensor kinase CheA